LLVLRTSLAVLVLLGLALPARAERYLVFLRQEAPVASLAASVDRRELTSLLERRTRSAWTRVAPDVGVRAAAETLWISHAVAAELTSEEAARLAASPGVARVEPVAEVRLEPVAEEALAEDPPDDDAATWGLRAIRALEAREAHGVDGSGVVVGILDTGIDAAHPDLTGRTRAWRDFVSSQPDPYDDNGHGTHCAGTIAGGASTGRAIGVAPGAELVVGKIFSKGGFTTSERILAGMQWVVDPDGVPGSGDEPRLVSNSWSGPAGSMTYLEAVRTWLALDILPVFAASNSGPKPETVRTPGGYPEALAVAAASWDGTIAEFSSRGPVVWNGEEIVKPDVAAPGNRVFSAWPGGGHKHLRGTSMATPHVAGLAALLAQASPGRTAAGMRDLLEATAADAGALGKDNDWGHGMVDAPLATAVAVDGGAVRGRVVDASGAPIPWARLSVVEAERSVLVQEDGAFRTLLPAGPFTLRAEAFGFLVGEVTGEAGSGETATMILTLDRRPFGTLAGFLVDPEGTPLEGWVHVLGTDLPPVVCGADGAFSIPLPPGTYAVRAQAYGFAAATIEGLGVAIDQVTSVPVALVRPPPVLVVDDDAGQGFEAWFVAALDALGEAHDLVVHDEVEGLSGRFLAQYETVVWLTGKDNRDCLSRRDQKALAEYLDLGGRLLLSGQEVGYTLGESLFFRERLGAHFVSDGTTVRTVHGPGIELAIAGGDGANNQIFPDAVEAAEGTGAETWLTYGNGDGAAVRLAKGNARVVYLGFGLEGVSTLEGRTQLMTASLAYLRPGAAGFAARVDAVDAVPARDAADALDLGRLGLALGDLVGLRFPGASLDVGRTREIERMRLYRAR
jgi:subtilisin family serine protease